MGTFGRGGLSYRENRGLSAVLSRDKKLRRGFAGAVLQRCGTHDGDFSREKQRVSLRTNRKYRELFSAGRKRNGHGHGICPLLCDNRRDVDGGCCVLNFIPSGTGENQGVLGKTGLFQEHEAPGAGSISGSRAVSARAVEDYGCYLSVMYRWSLDFKSQTLFGLWTGLGDSRCISGFGDGIISGSGGDFSDASGGQFPGGRISGFIWGDSGGKTDSGTQAHWESYGSFAPAGTAVRIFGDFFVRWFRFSSGTSVCASYLRNFKKFYKQKAIAMD